MKLSLKAIGLLQYMMSIGEEFTFENAVKEFTDGKASVRSALDELIEKEIVIRKQARDGGKFGRVEYYIKGDDE